MLGFGFGTSCATRRRVGGLVPPLALRPLQLTPVGLVAGTAADGHVIGATDGSALIASALPSGFTFDGDARTWHFDGSGSPRTAPFTLVETLAGAANSPRETTVSLTVAAGATLPGLTLNGAPNANLKAMLARVAGGTGRGRIVFKGDSTSMGQGGGLTTGTSADPLVQGASAALYRPSAVLADELGGVGFPALDNGFVGQSGTGSIAEWINYDPRTAFEGPEWELNPSQSLAGGGFFNGTGAGVIDFTPDRACDRYEAVFYNLAGQVAIAVGTGANAADVTITAPGATVSANDVTLPGTNSGFTRLTIAVSWLSTDPLRIVPLAGSPFLRSIRGWSSAGSAIDIINHASGGATSANQASINSAGNAWNNNEALGFDAPDLTIVNLGLNDGAQGVSASAYVANIDAIVSEAKLSGDVLLVSPHPASPAFAPTATQTALRDTLSAYAASHAIAHLDLFSYFGSWDAVAARSADGLVHLHRDGYAEIAQLYRRALQAMAA